MQLPDQINQKIPLIFLIVALIFNYGDGTPLLVIALISMPILIILFYKRNLDFVLLVYLITAGLLHRILMYPYRLVIGKQADIIPVISEAVNNFLNGVNPYQALYKSVVSNPQDHALVYPPFSFLYYVPFTLFLESVQFVEIISFSLVILMILLLATITSYKKMLIPIAIFSLSNLYFWFSLNGSNDTSASFLIFATLFWLILSKISKYTLLFYLSAIFLAFSITFKQYLIIPSVFILYYVYQNSSFKIFIKYVLATCLTLATIITPFLLTSPIDFFRNILGPINPPLFTGWNIYALLSLFSINFSKQIYQYLSLFDLMVTFLTIIFVILRFKPRTLISLSIFIPIVFFVSLFLAPFASASYIAVITPFLMITPIASDLDKLMQEVA